MNYSLKPQQALKFVILKNGDQYLWLFSMHPADTHVSIVGFVEESNWEPVAGGFYCFKVGNAISKTFVSYIEPDEPVLELFGWSDSFGMPRDVYNAAKPFLRKQIGENTIINEQIFKL